MKKNSRPGKQCEGETIRMDLEDKLSRYAVVSTEGGGGGGRFVPQPEESIAKHFGGRARARES